MRPMFGSGENNAERAPMMTFNFPSRARRHVS
jgi:hypothetical protein